MLNTKHTDFVAQMYKIYNGFKNKNVTLNLLSLLLSDRSATNTSLKQKRKHKLGSVSKELSEILVS